MADFDFVSGAEFRASLASDYAELNTAIGAGAWKAAHVLAGSIVEAVLADYLVVARGPGGKGKKPLEMDLGQLIAACRNDGILSERAAQLSEVVRSYRNLIHPGRAIRLDEAVDESGAKVALALVEMIVAEVGKATGDARGLTAEQIVHKVANDSSVMAILGQLLSALPEPELQRLLLELVPSYVLQMWAGPEDWVDAEEHDRFAACYHLCFARTGDDGKTAAMAELAKIVKEATGSVVAVYEDAFLRGPYLEHLRDSDARLVMTHVLGRLGSGVTVPLLECVEGMGPYLQRENVDDLVDPLVRQYRREKPRGVHDRIEDVLPTIWMDADPGVSTAIEDRLKQWAEFLDSKGDSDGGVAVRKLASALADYIPF